MCYLQTKFEYIRGAPQTTEIGKRIDMIKSSINIYNIDQIIYKGKECSRTFYQYDNDLKFNCLVEFVDLILLSTESEFWREYITVYFRMPWYGNPIDIFTWHLVSININAHKEILNEAELGLREILHGLEKITI
jgi:hypothetical protein